MGMEPHFKRMDGKRKGLFNFIQYIHETRIIRRGTWILYERT